MASSGHVDAQHPHPKHSSLSISTQQFFSDIALTGHTSKHDMHFLHFSCETFKINILVSVKFTQMPVA